jgi:hypothetical protein
MAQATLSRSPVVPVVPADVGNARATTVRHAAAINQALRGGIAATIGVTLAANATQSTFQDSRIGPYTYIGLSPATANASDALHSIWITTSAGIATINHASSPNTDQTFIACLLG